MKTYLLLLFFSLISCGQNYKDLHVAYKNSEEAKSIVSSTNLNTRIIVMFQEVLLLHGQIIIAAMV